jgi:hypothetical protein
MIHKLSLSKGSPILNKWIFRTSQDYTFEQNFPPFQPNLKTFGVQHMVFFISLYSPEKYYFLIKLFFV